MYLTVWPHTEAAKGGHTCLVRGAIVTEGQLTVIYRAERRALQKQGWTQAPVAGRDSKVAHLAAHLQLTSYPHRTREHGGHTYDLARCTLSSNPGPRPTIGVVAVQPLETTLMRQRWQVCLQNREQLLVFGFSMDGAHRYRHAGRQVLDLLATNAAIRSIV